MRFVARIVVATGLAANTFPAFPSEYCVHDAIELTAALQSASTDTDSVASIKLQSGEYDGDFTFWADRPHQASPTVELSGGWDATCSGLTTSRSRVIGELAFDGSVYPECPVVLDQVSVEGELRTNVMGAVTATRLTVDGIADFACCASSLVVERSWFSGQEFHAATGGERAIHRFANNVFAGIGTFYWFDQSTTASTVVFRGNTAVLSDFDVWVSADDTRFTFARNLIAAPDQGRFCLSAGVDDSLLVTQDNWIGLAPYSIPSGCAEMKGSGNVVEEFPSPFASATEPYDLHLRPGSPMIDYSEAADEDAAETDFDGNPRLFDGRVDVGAYEAMGIFNNGFEPYNLQR
jgi:hypothetical protein